MIYIIMILIIIVLVLGYISFNLLRKNEAQEDIVVGYLQYLDRISRVIELSDKKLQELDHKGAFKSDDEIGFVFEQIIQLQNILNEFQLKEISTPSKETNPPQHDPNT